MSVESLSWAFNVSNVTSAERLVLLGIANHDGDGGSWPSISSLARYACCSPRHVQRTIASLTDRGLVTVHKQAGGHAGMPADRRPNLYTLNRHPQVVNGVTPRSPRDDGRGDTQVVNGVTPRSPEPSLEPSSVTSEHVFTRAALVKATEKKRNSTPNKRQHIIDQTRAQRLTDMRPQPPIDIAATALLGEEHSLTYWLAEQTPHDLDDNEETLTRAERERLIESNRLTPGAKPE